MFVSMISKLKKQSSLSSISSAIFGISCLFFGSQAHFFGLSLLIVFTILASTQVCALEPCLITFTVFLQTVRLFTITTFAMFLNLNFRLESLGVPFDQGEHGRLSLIFMVWCIQAGNTITAFTNLIISEAVTIKF